jgi:hypothetical protein
LTVKNSQAALAAEAKAAQQTAAAQDKLASELKQTADAQKQSVVSVKNATISWTDFRSAYMVVLDVIRVGQQVWAETGQKFIDYSEQVKNMSRNIGASAEESSRLIQVADDVRLSYESMAQSMKFAQKNGTEMSIEGLAKLADEYNRLPQGVQRAQFLLDEFGKSGMEMGKLMEQGGAGIRSMSASIEQGLILDEAAIQSAEEYKVAVDGLSDSWDAFAMSIGKKVVPVISDLINRMNDEIAATKLAKEHGEILFLLSGEKYEAYVEEAKAAREAADASKEMADANTDVTETYDPAVAGLSAEEQALKDMEAAAKVAADKLEAISEANKSMLGSIEEFASLNESHAKSMEDAWARVDEAVASGNVEAINEARAAVGQLAADYVQATNEIVYSMITAKLSVDGLTDAEFNAALQAGKALGIFDDATIAQAQAANEQANAFVEAAAQQEQLAGAAQETTDATNETTDAAAGVTDETKNTEDASVAVTTAIQTATQAEDALTLSVSTTTAAVQAEKLAVDNVILSIQLATQQQDALTASIWLSVAAAQALASVPPPASSTAPPTAPVPPLPTQDAGGFGRAGQTYMIGTGAQPELFTPSTNGTFTPRAGKSEGGSNITVNINNPTGQTAEHSLRKELKSLSYLGVVR